MKGLFAKIKEESDLRKDTIIDGRKNHIMILGYAFILILPFVALFFPTDKNAFFLITGNAIPLRDFLFNIFVIFGDMLAFAIAAYVVKENGLLKKIFIAITFTKLLVLFDYIAFENRFESTLVFILVFNIIFIYLYNVLRDVDYE